MSDSVDHVAGCGNGIRDQFGQGRHIDVAQPFDVQAALADFVLAEASERVGVVVEVQRQVQRERGGPGGESDQWGVTFVATRISVVPCPESDDARAPHDSRLAGCGRQQGDQLHGVGAFAVVDA